MRKSKWSRNHKYINLTAKSMKKYLEKMEGILEERYSVNGKQFSLEDPKFRDFLSDSEFHDSDSRFNTLLNITIARNLGNYKKIRDLSSRYENIMSRISNMKAPGNYRDILASAFGISYNTYENNENTDGNSLNSIDYDEEDLKDLEELSED